MQKLLHVYYHSENRATSQIWKVLPKMVFPRFGGKNGGVLSMRMQVILDSSFARPGSDSIWGREERRVQGLDYSTPKTITENGAIRKRSPEWSDLKTMLFENAVF